MRKPEELFNGIFITQETREKIREAAEERSEKDIIRYRDFIYNTLDYALKMIAVLYPEKRDYIIYTPERGIGKTQVLLKLASEYNAVFVARESDMNFLLRMAEELGYKGQTIVSIEESRNKIPGKRIRTIIKEETVKLADIRKWINCDYVVGIEGV